MKIQVNYLAGKYKITKEIFIPHKNTMSGDTEYLPEDASFFVNLSSNEAKTLMKRKKNEDSLYSKLGFKEIMLVKDYEGN